MAFVTHLNVLDDSRIELPEEGVSLLLITRLRLEQVLDPGEGDGTYTDMSQLQT